MTEAAICLNISAIRQQFPALRRGVKGRPAVYFDGPAGSQVPFSVADAVHQYLLNTNANRGGRFATKSDAALDAAHAALADFVGAADPREICFGANMTTITLQVSRALARTWKPGDEIIVSRLDHDANFTPWILAAEDVGVRVHRVGLRPEDATLDLEDFERNLSDRTRLVAVGYAANSTGTINPVEHMTRVPSSMWMPCTLLLMDEFKLAAWVVIFWCAPPTSSLDHTLVFCGDDVACSGRFNRTRCDRRPIRCLAAG